MKKLSLVLGVFLLATSSFVGASYLDDAIEWAHDNGLTIYSDANTFNPSNGLRRDEAAKFFSVFREEFYPNASLSQPGNCNFKDIDQAWSDLKGFINSACSYGFLRGDNGYVYPQNYLTNAQAVTLVVRILDGLQSENTTAHWADNYYERAQELGLDVSNFYSKDTRVSRGNMIQLLYDAYEVDHENIRDTDTTDYSDKDPLERLMDIMGK